MDDKRDELDGAGMKKDSLIDIKEFNNKGPVAEMVEKMRLSMEMIRATTGIQIEMEKARASVTKAKYDALIAEGFTERQALELCKG